jgi:hypothetical protein
VRSLNTLMKMGI